MRNPPCATRIMPDRRPPARSEFNWKVAVMLDRMLHWVRGHREHTRTIRAALEAYDTPSRLDRQCPVGGSR